MGSAFPGSDQTGRGISNNAAQRRSSGCQLFLPFFFLLGWAAKSNARRDPCTICRHAALSRVPSPVLSSRVSAWDWRLVNSSAGVLRRTREELAAVATAKSTERCFIHALHFIRASGCSVLVGRTGTLFGA